jgi:hypothetical protein
MGTKIEEMIREALSAVNKFVEPEHYDRASVCTYHFYGISFYAFGFCLK